MPEKYSRILPIKSLSEVENPWKGISLNRCILLAVAIVVLSSGAEIVKETLEPFFKVAEEADVQDEFEESWWDSLAFWNWGEDDEIEQFSKNRAAMQPGERPKGVRKRLPERLLKERN
ncbi:hypothetical protein PGIGA_G00030680 [Pangasianodon gigas]|uniref:Uncharacterized protein n=1 Tax=Pangasianodon gigas TaxID=30993 RepID=A0ACC5WXM5_PANGG|nr:hypothetical protein [Pangasianodon gigas]